jgi:hypothetical protein
MFSGGVLGEGVGLELGKGVGKVKLYCKSMEGLFLKTAEQTIPVLSQKMDVHRNLIKNGCNVEWDIIENYELISTL